MARRKGKEYLATIMTSIAPIAICGRIRGYNRERVLKEAKNYAKELGPHCTRIELQSCTHNGDVTSEAEFEYYTSVKNITGWFDQNKDYPERKQA